MALVKKYIIFIHNKAVAKTDNLDAAKSWIKKAIKQVATTGNYNGDKVFVYDNFNKEYVYTEDIPWDQEADNRKWGRTSNPGISKLKNGVYGTIKLIKGRLIIKT